MGTALLAALAWSGTLGAGPVSPEVATVGRTIAEAPAGGPLMISSPAFAEGAPIPAQYTCTGGNLAPPLAWSTPSEAALVVDDPNAVRGTYIHWIVVGIPPGPGSTGDGQTPAGATSLPNSAGQAGYTGPCPPPGTGMHHYRFTLYAMPATLQLAPGLAGAQAVQAIAQASTGQAQLVGTFGA
ncbi:UPF0098 protein [Mycobacterium parmense]|uniref:UPF0098 protein n=1 Tax=Mycobacterium parmense TaxID=185642 RepID=A0A7I7YS35_9MYCO|nr:UPF0098 protein [Mycobacterium parmense]